MARPRKNDDEKRQLISIRLDAGAKLTLEQAAKAADRSIGAEAEKRIAGTLGLDDEGLELLATITREIRAIEQSTRKSWHRNLKTWSAVAEMLRTMPPRQKRPDTSSDDELVVAAYQRLADLADERRHKVDKLALLGLTIPEESSRERAPQASALEGRTLVD